MIRNNIAKICHDKTGESGTGTSLFEEQQTNATTNKTCALAMDLMERVCNQANLNRAYKRVKANKGAPGVDGITIEQLKPYIIQHKEQLIKSLLAGNYKPQPVRKVAIPKPDGGERELGIPTVIDRLIQQAIHQVLEPIFDKGFSKSSYGFRPNRSAHAAVKQAKAYVEDGHTWVVDIDLAKFFDRVNHDILMSKLAKRIGDKRLLKLIRGYLTAGIMQDGVVMARDTGTPQGGPLSPLLSNIMLDELDRELERRGHKFARYADDCNIYVKSKLAGERVYASINQFLGKKLKLQVNEEKSAVALVQERKFLGYQILNDGRLTVAPRSIQRAKDKIRELTWRSQGRSFEVVIKRLNVFLQGWFQYYKLAETSKIWQTLDGWIRRKLRCYRLKQRKKGYSIAKLLMSLGISEKESRQIGSSGKGCWRLSHTKAVDQALSIAWFRTQGLINLSEKWSSFVKSLTGTAVCDNACTVV